MLFIIILTLIGINVKSHWAAIDLDHTLLDFNGKISLKSLVSIKKYQDLGG